MPAFIHGLIQRMKGFGSVLGFVTFKGAFEVIEILLRVGNGDGQIGRICRMERKRCRPNRIEWYRLRGSETGIIQLDAGFLRLHDLCDGIGN